MKYFWNYKHKLQDFVVVDTTSLHEVHDKPAGSSSKTSSQQEDTPNSNVDEEAHQKM
jgi:hypothetical protein